MQRRFQLTKDDSADIAFATSSLIIGAITFEEFKEWLYFVIEHSDEVPSYFFDILNAREKFNFTLKVADYLGFWAAWDASDSELDALRGIGFYRFPEFHSDVVQRDQALKALAQNPHVEKRFREMFPFITWSL